MKLWRALAASHFFSILCVCVCFCWINFFLNFLTKESLLEMYIGQQCWSYFHVTPMSCLHIINIYGHNVNQCFYKLSWKCDTCQLRWVVERAQGTGWLLCQDPSVAGVAHRKWCRFSQKLWLASLLLSMAILLGTLLRERSVKVLSD